MNPDFDNILADDLRDDDRLKTLHLEAVRRKFWPNNVRTVLEFFSFTAKALHDDKWVLCRGGRGAAMRPRLPGKGPIIVRRSIELASNSLRQGESITQCLHKFDNRILLLVT